jgi:glycosyltransferase involved in cell wall biosynthesis
MENKTSTPLINIITRTRNRPGFFQLNVSSLNQQTYKNLHHIVTYQVDEDIDYISNYKYSNTTLVKVPNLIKDNSLEKDIEGLTLTHSPYNLFINEAHKSIKEGWVMYLDDDDILSFTNTIEFLVSEINKYDLETKHLWKVQFPNWTTPTDFYFRSYIEGKPFKNSQISMIGMLFHSSHLDKIQFHEWACGDYFAFKELDKKLPKRNMIDLPLTKITTVPGGGQRKDI